MSLQRTLDLHRFLFRFTLGKPSPSPPPLLLYFSGDSRKSRTQRFSPLNPSVLNERDSQKKKKNGSIKKSKVITYQRFQTVPQSFHYPKVSLPSNRTPFNRFTMLLLILLPSCFLYGSNIRKEHTSLQVYLISSENHQKKEPIKNM